MKVPDSVKGEPATQLYNSINDQRAQIKLLAEKVKFAGDITKSGESTPSPSENRGETIANLMLAYRHLEDASMRLGKALQAIDGGVSVYDKATTVGA